MTFNIFINTFSIILCGHISGVAGQSHGSVSSISLAARMVSWVAMIVPSEVSSVAFSKNTIPYLGNSLFAVSLKLHFDIVSSELWSQDGRNGCVRRP